MSTLYRLQKIIITLFNRQLHILLFKFKFLFRVIFVACKYVIDDKSVVRERGCGGVGVTGTETFCKNIRKDVVECYCTTDYCNGVDNLNTATSKAEEHFRRLADATKQETSTVANVPGVAVNNKCSVLGLALVVFLSLMWG